jgi:predicted RNase H-like HicB family nuclease
MSQAIRFRLEYWKDGDWYVGRLPQIPGVFSQGATLQELEENIRDAYRLMLEEQTSPTSAAIQTKDIEVPA